MACAQSLWFLQCGKTEFESVIRAWPGLPKRRASQLSTMESKGCAARVGHKLRTQWYLLKSDSFLELLAAPAVAFVFRLQSISHWHFSAAPELLFF